MGDGLKRAVNAARATQGKPPKYKNVPKHQSAPKSVNADMLGLDVLMPWLAKRQGMVIYRLADCERARAEGHGVTVKNQPWVNEPDWLVWRMEPPFTYTGLLRRSEAGYWLAYIGRPTAWTDEHFAAFDVALKPLGFYPNISIGPNDHGSTLKPMLSNTPFAELHWIGFDGKQNNGLSPIADGVLDVKRQREFVYHTMNSMARCLYKLARAARLLDHPKT